MILEKTVVFQLEIIVVVKRVIHMMDVHGKEYEKKTDIWTIFICICYQHSVTHIFHAI